MTNAGKIENEPKPGSRKTGDHTYINSLREQLSRYKREKDILLDLSNDITKVREKNDLIKIFSSRLKGLFEFGHAAISLIDRKNNKYFPFLYDTETHPLRHNAGFNSVITAVYPLDDPFIANLLNSTGQSTIIVKDILHEPAVPEFLTAQFACGIRSVLLTPLRTKMELMGFIYISSYADSFPEDFKDILNGIAPHLSNAVTNIIINEEIRYKEFVNETLLALSNDMVTVRNRTDLLNVIKFGLKKLIYFTHNVITVLNENGETYQAFLTDPDSAAIQLPEYGQMLAIANPVNDGFYDVASQSNKPVVFNMTACNRDNAPLWFKLNYEAGGREMLIKVLPGGEYPKHSLILFSDKADNFNERAIDIIETISSQLSTAASNIAANEEILNKDRDKSFLLAFSHDIASARTKNELSLAIHQSLKKLGAIRAYFIRTLHNDGEVLKPFMHDQEVHYKSDPEFKKLLDTDIKKSEGITGKVFVGDGPVLIDFVEEVNQGNTDPYIEFWKKLGPHKTAFQKMVGTPLRVGSTELGVLWVITESINTGLLEGISAQISVAISNILANEQVLTYKQMLEVENDHLKEQIKTIYNFSNIIGSGPAMQKVYHLMSLVAESNSTVLLLGETGTGKELIARAIHNSSSRKDKLMVKVNCAALPANLVESELFGHERGSFTGAIERRIGKFELANNGTLFLDEIGEMPLETQVKLLRVIQEREVERVGGKTTIKIDVRIIVATNRNLEQEVKAGRFRSDLYYRLNVFPITLPPLRNRLEDIPSLANFFLERYSKNSGKKVTSITPQCLKELRSYAWPGNVRELEHLIERSILLTQGNVLTQIQLPKTREDNDTNSPDHAHETLQQLERNYIVEVLKKCGGKIAGSDGAAAILDMPSTTLHSKMKKLGISKADYFIKKA